MGYLLRFHPGSCERRRESSQGHRGLLPFRVWQIFDAMVEVRRGRKGARVRVCRRHANALHRRRLPAACISPTCTTATPSERSSTPSRRGNEQGKIGAAAFRQGVHTGYEDTMISAFRERGARRPQADAENEKGGNDQQRLRGCEADHRDDEKDVHVDTADRRS